MLRILVVTYVGTCDLPDMYALSLWAYCIASFVCEVLICANCARCHGLAYFNSTVTFNSAIVLGVSQLCALLYLM